MSERGATVKFLFFCYWCCCICHSIMLISMMKLLVYIYISMELKTMLYEHIDANFGAILLDLRLSLNEYDSKKTKQNSNNYGINFGGKDEEKTAAPKQNERKKNSQPKLRDRYK